MFRTRRLLPTSARAGLALGISALLLAGATTAAQAKSSTPAPAAKAAAHHRPSHGKSVPRVAQDWLGAWNTGDADRMASLFTPDGTYTDHAFGASFTGPDGAAQWVTITTSSIGDLRGNIRWARRYGKVVVVS
jgi:hypothetical protein